MKEQNHETRPFGNRGEVALALPGRMPHAIVFSRNETRLPTQEEKLELAEIASLYASAPRLVEALQKLLLECSDGVDSYDKNTPRAYAVQAARAVLAEYETTRAQLKNVVEACGK